MSKRKTNDLGFVTACESRNSFKFISSERKTLWLQSDPIAFFSSSKLKTKLYNEIASIFYYSIEWIHRKSKSNFRKIWLTQYRHLSNKITNSWKNDALFRSKILELKALRKFFFSLNFCLVLYWSKFFDCLTAVDLDLDLLIIKPFSASFYLMRSFVFNSSYQYVCHH